MLLPKNSLLTTLAILHLKYIGNLTDFQIAKIRFNVNVFFFYFEEMKIINQSSESNDDYFNYILHLL